MGWGPRSDVPHLSPPVCSPAAARIGDVPLAGNSRRPTWRTRSKLTGRFHRQRGNVGSTAEFATEALWQPGASFGLVLDRPRFTTGDVPGSRSHEKLAASSPRGGTPNAPVCAGPAGRV